MERRKDGSQVETVVMRQTGADRRSAAGRPAVSLLPEDAVGQAQAGEEDQSAGGDAPG